MTWYKYCISLSFFNNTLADTCIWCNFVQHIMLCTVTPLDTAKKSSKKCSPTQNTLPVCFVSIIRLSTVYHKFSMANFWQSVLSTQRLHKIQGRKCSCKQCSCRIEKSMHIYLGDQLNWGWINNCSLPFSTEITKNFSS